MSWQLCKGSSFHRLTSLGCSIVDVPFDNCCQWRAKLQSVFRNNTLIQLDPLHTIQMFTSIKDLFEIRLFCMGYAKGKDDNIESDLRCINPLTPSPEGFY